MRVSAAGSAKAGDQVPVTTRVSASGGRVSGVRVTGVSASSAAASVSGGCASGCGLGNLAGGESTGFTVTVSVPADTTTTTRVTVTVSVGDAAAASGASAGSATVTFTPRNVTLPTHPNQSTGQSPTVTVGPPSTLPQGTTTPISLPGMPAPLVAVTLPSILAPQTAPGLDGRATPIRLAAGGSRVVPATGLASVEAAWLAVLLAAFTSAFVRLRLRLARHEIRPGRARRRTVRTSR